MFFVTASAWGRSFFLTGPSLCGGPVGFGFCRSHPGQLVLLPRVVSLFTWAPLHIHILPTSSYDDNDDRLPSGPRFLTAPRVVLDFFLSWCVLPTVGFFRLKIFWYEIQSGSLILFTEENWNIKGPGLTPMMDGVGIWKLDFQVFTIRPLCHFLAIIILTFSKTVLKYFYYYS